MWSVNIRHTSIFSKYIKLWTMLVLIGPGNAVEMESNGDNVSKTGMTESCCLLTVMCHNCSAFSKPRWFIE